MDCKILTWLEAYSLSFHAEICSPFSLEAPFSAGVVSLIGATNSSGEASMLVVAKGGEYSGAASLAGEHALAASRGYPLSPFELQPRRSISLSSQAASCLSLCALTHHQLICVNLTSSLRMAKEQAS